ncbi:hypothetical protein [Mammaliicoccus sciuri]|uniref:hypothetical protein n=1 Tax=Mammaliicoccus sciuri TaxID=1296 RepID=UPI002B257128|nr:hypothetical protein [Mammaliicoccus sciuri]WQK75221.1 hypothetical protein P3U33_05685 [Mammaliicoccus sciuri]
MKYIVIEPRGYAKVDDTTREILEFDVNKIVGVDSFIQQQVGKEAVSRKVGDYVLWISNPETVVETEDEEDIVVPETPDLMCNMLINEVEFAFGGVVVTANHTVTEDLYAGLEDQDVANIMNLFTNTDTVLVEDVETGDLIAVDRVFDALLSYSSVETEVPEDPIIEEIPTETEEFDYETFEETYEDSDPELFDELEFGEKELEVPDDVPPEIVEDISTEV